MALNYSLMDVRPASPRDLVIGLQRTLQREGIDYDAVVAQFGQVAASESRGRGQMFTLRDHVRGLILSQLSNQRPWGPIARNLARISEILLDFDPVGLEAADPEVLVHHLRSIRCGNRSISAQMRGLAANIRTLRKIEIMHGSLDSFVTGADPDTIARHLSSPGPFKLRQVGYTLALEYLRNVGIRAAKPDVHVQRVISSGRLGYSSGHPSEEEAQRLVTELAGEAGCNPTYLDNLLWLFCAKDYGNVCAATPRCEVCFLKSWCRYPVA